MEQESTILIVDDEAVGRETLEALLMAQGYDLAFANNGAEALSKAGELTPDLILLDVMMPGMDGFEVCRRLRTDPLLAEVPVIMVTALDDRDSRLRGIEVGADDFISKPFDRAELRAKARTVTRLNRYRQLLLGRTHRQQAEEEIHHLYQELQRYADRLGETTPSRTLRVGSLAQWFKDNEATIVPTWIRAVRRRSERDRIFTTQQLAADLLLSYFDCFVKATTTGILDNLEALVKQIATDRASKQYNLDDVLLIPFLLRETLWTRLTASVPPADTLEMIRIAQPIFERSLTTLVGTFAQVTAAALKQRLEETELLTRRLAETAEETDRALTKLEILYELSRALKSTLDANEILGFIAEELASVREINRCIIWLKDEATSELHVAVAKGMDSDELADIRLFGQPSIVVEALLTGQVKGISHVSDKSCSRETLAPHFVGCSIVALPLISKDQAIGVILVDSEADAGFFDASTIDLLQSAAEQAAMALRNAQLFDQVKRFNQELEQRVKERTQELEKANRDLAKLDRTKSDFISIAAHELKTPMTVIRGYADILLKEDRSDMGNECLDGILQGILKGTERLQAIIEDMIDISKIDGQALSLQLKSVSIGATVELALGKLGAMARERKQTIAVEPFIGLPHIQGDPQRLHQVLINVIGNGIKYTPDGGRITISGRLLKAKGALEEDFVEIIVADTGIGIDKEELEYIFGKFYRTEPIELHSTGKTKFKGAGAGLGLAIAKGIVEAHGGRIWAESEGRDEVRCPGSRFHILLPVKARRFLAKGKGARFSAQQLGANQDVCIETQPN
jgi:signal transduction histidine kinase/DNA-binding response OmpR family regulator